MARVRCGFALVAAFALVGAACSVSTDSDQLDVGKAEKEIRTLADRAYGNTYKVGAVSCPEDVALKKGGTFTCTVAVAGAPLTIKLRQTDAKGNVHISEADAVILTEKVEDLVTSYETDKKPTKSVSCAKGPLITRAPGKSIRCDVVFADGGKGVATLVVRSMEGRVALISVTGTER